MRFLHKFALLLSILIILSSLIQFKIFDRSFMAATSTLFLTINERAASNVKEQLVAYFDKIEKLLKTISVSDEFKNNQVLLNELHAIIPELDVLLIINRQGDVVLSSGTRSTNLQANLSQREYFQQAIRGETFISDVFTGRGGNQVISIATPLLENGAITGVVVGVVRLHGNILASLFDDKAFGQGGFISIVDNQGTIVYHKDNARIGQKGLLFAQLQGLSGSAVLQYDSDGEYYLGYSCVPGLNWTVIVSTPAAEMTQLRNSMIYKALAISLLVVLVIIAIGTYTVRRYTGPLDRLLQAFSTLSKGDYKKIDPAGYTTEFATMIQVYNDTVKKLEEVHTNLKVAADVDGLTGLYNRRAFDRLLETISGEMQAHSLETLGIMLLDIDYFKQINDAKGHMIGDEVLKEFAEIITGVAGSRSAFRFGGDEFAVILRNSSGQTICRLAEEIRSRCEQSPFGYTVSIGIAVYPGHADSIDKLLELADQALYSSKAGKNKVTVSPGCIV